MTKTSAPSPTATLRLALAAYDPARPRWQQQRQYAALRKATDALAAKIATWEGPDGKLEQMWGWLERNPGHPEFATREAQFMRANEVYTEARDLLGEADQVLKGVTA